MRSLRWLLTSLQFALFSAGVVLLGYCTFVVSDSWLFQHRERDQFESLQAAGLNAPPLTAPLPPPAATAPSGLIGSIAVNRLGIEVMVMEGTDAATLQRAAGHIEGTALPGEPGNVGISAHRDTFFRPLRNIRQNDIVTVTTLAGEYRYRVVNTKVVSPEDVTVLDSDRNEILTLVTCYPFYYVGAAPNRFIVRAERLL